MKEKKRIVVRRVQRKQQQVTHSGGAWKIAYADFMTAMMAFFLVMWLLAIATPKQREGVAEYFRVPLKATLQGGQKSGNSSSVIPGGGPDHIRVEGEVRNQGLGDDTDAGRLDDLKQRLDALVENNPVVHQFRSQILVDLTPAGLRLQIVDSDKRPMFDLASSTVVPHMRAILRELAPVLNELPNKITLSGHTDSVIYNRGGDAYGNWELSADRANASRRELSAGGLSEGKVLRVVGLADSMHLDQTDPLNPLNRRISILVLNRHTQEQIERENSGKTMPTAQAAAIPAAKASADLLKTLAQPAQKQDALSALPNKKAPE